MRKSGTVAAVVLVMSAAASSASALGVEEIRRAREALRTYDVDGDRTTTVIRALGELAPVDPVDAREGRFLRAVAAADLMVLAARTEDAALLRRVAEAVGVPESRLEATLRDELGRLSFGAYGPVSRDARHGLAIAEALRQGRPVDWKRYEGLRRDALYVAEARAAADRGGLAQLAADPCAVACEERPYAAFGPDGRRAAHALAQAGAAMARLEDAALRGDPFATAVAPAVADDRSALSQLVLRGAPQIPADASVVDVSSELAEATVDAIVIVTAQEIRWAWVPRVRLEVDGSLAMVTPGEPTLPATERVALPGHVRAALVSLPHAAPVFEAIAAALPDARVAVGAASEAPGHVLARVLYTAGRAGISGPLLFGRDAQGVARAVPTRVVQARDAAGAVRHDVSVRVRMGGYTVDTRAGAPSDIPRVRDADDRLRFDVATLATTARSRAYATASLSFMSAVEAGPLFAAAFSLEPTRPLTLILP